MSDALAQELLDNYIYQKEELVRKAGSKRQLDRDRMETLMRPRIERMARVVEDWDIRPDVLMAAVFAWASRSRHPDGPMPNMLFSVKYLTKALSNYLQVPYEVVMDRRGMSLFLERMDDEFVKYRGELERVGVTDLTTASSYPVEVRYLMAVQNFDAETAFFLAQDLLEKMSADRRIELWCNHRGIKYEAVAASFNKRKKNYQ